MQEHVTNDILPTETFKFLKLEVERIAKSKGPLLWKNSFPEALYSQFEKSNTSSYGLEYLQMQYSYVCKIAEKR